MYCTKILRYKLRHSYEKYYEPGVLSNPEIRALMCVVLAEGWIARDIKYLAPSFPAERQLEGNRNSSS